MYLPLDRTGGSGDGGGGGAASHGGSVGGVGGGGPGPGPHPVAGMAARNARMEVVCVIDLHFPNSLTDRKKAFEEVCNNFDQLARTRGANNALHEEDHLCQISF